MSQFELLLAKRLPDDLMKPKVAAEVTISPEGDFVVRYNVRDSKLNARTGHPKDRSVWGLWDTDVCEVFISSAQDESLVASAPYFEFQVSPFAQYFELEVFEPRKRYNTEFQSGIKVSAEIKTVRAWEAEVRVPLTALKLDATKPIFGNVYACLLREPNRAYFSINHPEAANPDFHVPSKFLRLV